jgi:hypothetical protein
MPLPERIRVKLSTEAAEAISLTRVVVQEMPLGELLEQMVAVAGKDRERIREYLRRGTLVSGASRFRWDGWEADAADVEQALRVFPDPEPARRFSPQACVRAVLRGERAAIEVPRAAGARRGFFRRASFWDALLEAAVEAAPIYETYSYRERADVYVAALDAPKAARVREAAGLLRYATLREHVRRGGYDRLELFTVR